MSDIANKLLLLKQVKEEIASAIQEKGVEVNTNDFTEYADLIKDISGGGGYTPTELYEVISSLMSLTDKASSLGTSDFSYPKTWWISETAGDYLNGSYGKVTNLSGKKMIFFLGGHFSSPYGLGFFCPADLVQDTDYLLGGSGTYQGFTTVTLTTMCGHQITYGYTTYANSSSSVLSGIQLNGSESGFTGLDRRTTLFVPVSSDRSKRAACIIADYELFNER